MNTPVLRNITLAEVKVADRLRPVSEAGVASILASVSEIGRIKDPIHVRKKRGELVLMAGGHRMEAYARLGITEVEAWVWTDITDDFARLIEIDDNLAGAEMNALDTSVFLAERKEVYERLHPETKADAFRGNQHTGKLATDIMSVATFAASTAEKFGLTDRHVRRLIAIGSALHPSEVQQLRAAKSPVKLTDLQALAKIGDAAERRHVVEAFSTGQAKNIADAIKVRAAGEAGEPAVVESPHDRAFNDLLKVWKRTPFAVRKRFVFEMSKELWEANNRGLRPEEREEGGDV